METREWIVDAILKQERRRFHVGRLFTSILISRRVLLLFLFSFDRTSILGASPSPHSRPSISLSSRGNARIACSKLPTDTGNHTRRNRTEDSRLLRYDRARVTFSARILRNVDTTRFDRGVRGEFEEVTCGNCGLPFGETGTPVGIKYM